MSDYSNDNLKWDSYQFSDPFATNAFVCFNTKSKTICRPNCEQVAKAETKQEVRFFEDIHSINLNEPYVYCSQCDPSSPKTGLNLQLIKMTINAINESIGFTRDTNELKRRVYSIPSLNVNDNDRQLTRNETEHFKLVELACRHIASAAVNGLSKQLDQQNSNEDGNKKKRRGGVLGFKELALKSKLSAWHFHRVFKSVTGLTPKSYGDKCWNYLKSRDRPQTSRQMVNQTHSHSKSASTGNIEYPLNADTTNNSLRRSSMKDENDKIYSSDESSSLSDSTSASKFKKRKVSLPNDSSSSSSKSSISTSHQNSFTSNSADRLNYNGDLFHPEQKNSIDINKNSLDINGNQFKSFNFDSLNSNSFDLTNFNSKVFSPHFTPFDLNQQQSTNHHLQHHQQPHQQPNTQNNYHQGLSTQQSTNNNNVNANFQQQPSYLFGTANTSSTLLHQPIPLSSSSSSSASVSHSQNFPLTTTFTGSQIDENQWPTLQASTPPDQIVTPNSTASVNSNKNTNSFQAMYEESLNTSPLEDALASNLQNYNDNGSEDGYLLESLNPSSSYSTSTRMNFGFNSNSDFSSNFVWNTNNTNGEQDLFVGNEEISDSDDFLKGLSNSDFIRMDHFGGNNLPMNIN